MITQQAQDLIDEIKDFVTTTLFNKIHPLATIVGTALNGHTRGIFDMRYSANAYIPLPCFSDDAVALHCVNNTVRRYDERTTDIHNGPKMNYGEPLYDLWFEFKRQSTEGANCMHSGELDPTADVGTMHNATKSILFKISACNDKSWVLHYSSLSNSQLQRLPDDKQVGVLTAKLNQMKDLNSKLEHIYKNVMEYIVKFTGPILNINAPVDINYLTLVSKKLSRELHEIDKTILMTIYDMTQIRRLAFKHIWPRWNSDHTFVATVYSNNEYNFNITCSNKPPRGITYLYVESIHFQIVNKETSRMEYEVICDKRKNLNSHTEIVMAMSDTTRLKTYSRNIVVNYGEYPNDPAPLSKRHFYANLIHSNINEMYNGIRKFIAEHNI